MGDVLRGPGPVPEPPVPFVGRDGEVALLDEQLSFGRPPTSRSKVVVLHGPAGVGKSALAAGVARAVAGSRGRRVHWISVGDTPSAETAILRLLAEHAAPRREIVAAALMEDDRAFSERLRRQCAENIRGSVIVLDDVGPEYGLSLVQALGPGGNQVIITSRHHARWEDANTYQHAVRPLDAQDALQLVKHVSRPEPEDGIRSAENEFVSAAQGLPALLRIAGLILRPPFTPPRLPVNTPAALFALAWDRLDVAEKDLLQRLAVWGPGGPFTLRSVEALLWENGRQADAQRILDGLARYGLVHEVREGAFTLPSPLVDAVPPLMSRYELSRLKVRVPADLLAAARDAAWDTAGLLDGRDQPPQHDQHVVWLTPDELAEHVDEFMALLPKGRPASHEEEGLINALATLLAVRGDAHRLVALHRISESATRRPLGSAVRRLGLSRQAWVLLQHDTPENVAYEAAAASYCTGQLADALATLDQAPPPEGVDAAWHAVVRGASLCDQGRPAESERFLLEAAELHRRAGCPRGRGWALLHLARACLLIGQTHRAEHSLGQAIQTLRSAGDEGGENWAATERIRLHLLRGRTDLALDTAQRALTAHEETEDIRGMGWTCHYLGLVHARRGQADDARVALMAASDHFRECADDLGTAWTQHRLALLAPDARPWDKLSTCVSLFEASGCPLGQAWSVLELALRRPGLAADNSLRAAQQLFNQLNDQAGLAWTASIRALQREGVVDPTAPPWQLRRDTKGRDLIEEALEEFWQTASASDHHAVPPVLFPWQDPVIPLRARDIVGVRAEDTRMPPVPLPVPAKAALPSTPHCQVHLTLLDNTPSVAATARLLLRVVPDDDHPWAVPESDPPWLTAVATPLTPASADPPTALLRPSEHQEHGAEFDFTAHRPGVHVIRFTIALERTGTVLQQVETELEILDTDAPGEFAAPHAAARRGR
ncbi:NB-ARC domain-containing protein [Streptomyces sp. R35]|uniref:NB-ARC domain-containing protein n=1 Tax=Streptomyces sp. R35 TaxID=3238630 RepID=A0AB39SD11_9ACTN